MSSISRAQFQKSLNKAHQGNPVEQFMVGQYYTFGIGASVDKGKAKEFSDLALAKLQMIQKEAENGNARAQFVWGKIHFGEYGVPRNNKIAAIWFRKAAEQGNADGQTSLGIMYQWGVEVPRNYTEAVKWFRKAAEQGDGLAQINLGSMYSQGNGVQLSYDEAFKWYKKAAEQGDPRGQTRLALSYKSPKGGPNYLEAVKWFKRAAEQGDASAQSYLACMYRDGLGVQKNHNEAVKWFRKAAEQGDTIGQNDLGSMYRDGLGVQKNEIEAVKWFRKAAEQGYLEAQDNLARSTIGQNDLGCMYRDGLGVKQNYVEAVKWFKKAAELGHADAQNNLGNMYVNGEGLQKNHAEAVKWFKKAAEQGNAYGQFSLGDMYQWGFGVQRNYTEAVKWFRKAAEQGNSLGQGALGSMYENGHGVQQSYDEAVKWYRKAAEQGDAWALSALGSMYENGRGVQLSYDEAMKCFRKAAERGNVQAPGHLERVQKRARDIQQNVNKSTQERPEKLVESKKTQEPNRPENVHKPNPHTPIVKKPTPTPQKVAVVESTPKKESVKPSQEKKFKETPEQEITEDSGYHETLLSQHWEIKSDDLRNKVQVGSGGCGKVFKGSWQGSQVAIKELHGRLGPAELEELRKEALIMSQLHHPHIIHLFGITQASPHCLVMEWMEKGSFYRVLREEQLNFEQKGKILLGAARGLAFLHSRNMIHRDIKSLNILLKKSYKAKIGDFGLSQVKKSLRSQSNQGLSAGTLHWKAPEVLKFGGKHTLASDVYAFGIVMWEALTGKDPYEEAENEFQISLHVQGGGRPEIPEGTPKWYQELMEKCWSQNPADRPSAEEVASTLAKELDQKPAQAEKPQRPTLPPRSKPTSSGYLVHTPQPTKKPTNQIPQTSGYLDNA
jgi:TPR repeat protein